MSITEVSEIDFTAERNFVAVAKSHMDAFAQDMRSAAPYDARQCQSRLQDIHHCASQAQARAVAVCAKRCEALSQNANVTQSYELRTLARLISQFETGLLEIDPQGAEIDQVDALIMDSPVVTTAVEVFSPADVLGELIDFAPHANRAALGRLIQFSKEGEAPLRSKAIPAPVTPPKLLVSLESLMGPVTNNALSTAHRGFKQVSLSYACEDVMMTKDIAKPLSNVLTQLCDVIVRHSVRHPAVREGTGKTGTSQISITASETASGLTIDVFCDDQALAKSALNGAAMTQAVSSYKQMGGDLEVSKGRSAGVLICISHPAPRKFNTAEPMPAQELGSNQADEYLEDYLAEALA